MTFLYQKSRCLIEAFSLHLKHLLLFLPTTMYEGSFIIENIIHTSNAYDWYNLIDLESGKLKKSIADTISRNTGNKDIEILFSEIVEMRNRIIHGFRITSKQGEQILATKTRKKDGNIQFEITKEYLLDFIKKNEELSDMLYKYRGY